MRLAFGTTIVAALFLAHVEQFLEYVNDDSFVTFRYSRFLALGRGPYFNEGEHVEGYTNFLHMLILALAHRIGGAESLVPSARGIGIACGLLAIVGGVFLARLLARSHPRTSPHAGTCAVLAGAIVAVSPYFAVNAASGLETTLFSLCITAGVTLGVAGVGSGGWRGAGIAFALAGLTRPEGSAVFALWWIASAAASFRDRSALRRLALDAVLVALVLALHLLFRFHFYDGELVPNTYFAKRGGYWAVDPTLYIGQGILPTIGGLVGLTGAAVGLAWGATTWRFWIPVVAVGCGGPLLILFTGSDWMIGYRLVVPYLPVLGGLVAWAWIRATSRVWSGRESLAVLAVPVVAAILWTSQSEERERVRERAVLAGEGSSRAHEPLARWLCEGRARPGDVVALMDIGLIGYECIDQTIRDVTGLTDRFIAKQPGSFLQKTYDPAYVLDEEPRYVVLAFLVGGDPDRPANLSIEHWTDIEGRIFDHPSFHEHYRREAAGTFAPGGWKNELARRLGGTAVFGSLEPGREVLVVFERDESPERAG